MSTFKDIGKAPSDLLTKNFINSDVKKREAHAVTFEGKSSAGTKVVIKGVHKPDDSFDGTVTVNPTLSKENGVTGSFEFKSENTKAKFIFDDTKLPKGLTAAVTVEANPHTVVAECLKKKDAEEKPAEGEAEKKSCPVAYGAAVDVAYGKSVNDDVSVNVNLKVEHVKKSSKNQFDFAVAVAHKSGFSAGVNAVAALNTPSVFDKLALAGQWKKDDTVVSFYLNGDLADVAGDAKPAEKQRVISGGVKVYHQLNDKVKVAAEVSNKAVTVATQKQQGAETVGLKADTAGIVGAYWTAPFTALTTVTAAAQVNAAGFSKGNTLEPVFSVNATVKQ